MRRPALRAASVAAVAAAAFTVLPASPAHAINKTVCGGWLPNPELTHVVNANAQDHHCFANAGSLDVAIYDIDVVSSGNNKVTITYQQKLGGAGEDITLEKWQRRDFNSAHKISRIRIH
ncbi:beta/gamma crystallin domain-containing protein [Streptomyces sp. NPDC044984]|uniref:beta/gamma crystallin domain-containing protein n=1 Tax=Streptomyces sp. NPDC044984 TaxID=3154335 RepID=UPI0033E09565